MILYCSIALMDQMKIKMADKMSWNLVALPVLLHFLLSTYACIFFSPGEVPPSASLK